jgi:hypothetical protein
LFRFDIDKYHTCRDTDPLLVVTLFLFLMLEVKEWHKLSYNRMVLGESFTLYLVSRQVPLGSFKLTLVQGYCQSGDTTATGCTANIERALNSF